MEETIRVILNILEGSQDTSTKLRMMRSVVAIFDRMQEKVFGN